ncbi:MAG: hypothetical protein WBW81_06390, partial [Methylocella sp.]
IWWNLKRPNKANLKASDQNGDLPPGTVVSLDGSCDFKIGGKNFECDSKLAYMHFTNGRTQINVLPKILGAVAFSGGKDLQPKPEYYFLTDSSSAEGRSFPPMGFAPYISRRTARLSTWSKTVAYSNLSSRQTRTPRSYFISKIQLNIFQSYPIQF